MKFRTEITIPPRKGSISHSTPIFMTGSCFTSNISRQLSSRLFSVLANPLGTLYNPVSIAESIKYIAAGRDITEGQLFERDGLWHWFYAHSSLSRIDKIQTLDAINISLEQANAFISSAHTAIITLGTSYVFRHRDTGRIVANCHKLPSAEFDRFRLTCEECAGAIAETVENLLMLRPGIQIIFTVSPIRHTADGLHGNQLSKSTLLLSIDEVISRYPKSCHYFPSYEILIDDLRDYRFYASDLKHPSEQAIEYIYEKFAETYFTAETISTSEKALRITKRLQHVHKTDADRADFEAQTRLLLNEFLSEHPEINHDLYITPNM